MCEKEKTTDNMFYQICKIAAYRKRKDTSVSKMYEYKLLNEALSFHRILIKNERAEIRFVGLALLKL